MSGFLLNGGLGWNVNSWGPACFSVEAAHVVTADGRLVFAKPGATPGSSLGDPRSGPSFFGVVMQYTLKLYSVPRAITSSTYFYPVEPIAEVGEWLADVTKRLPSEVELTMFVSPAPPEFAEQCRSANGFVAILAATAFQSPLEHNALFGEQSVQRRPKDIEKEILICGEDFSGLMEMSRLSIGLARSGISSARESDE